MLYGLLRALCGLRQERAGHGQGLLPLGGLPGGWHPAGDALSPRKSAERGDPASEGDRRGRLQRLSRVDVLRGLRARPGGAGGQGKHYRKI